MMTPFSRTTKIHGGYPTSAKYLSYVQQSHHLASHVKFIFFGLSPFLQNRGDITVRYWTYEEYFCVPLTTYVISE